MTMAPKRDENGNGHSDPRSDETPRRDGFTFYDRTLLEDTAKGVGLAFKRIDALVEDSRKRHEEARRWRGEVNETLASVQVGVLRLVAELEEQKRKVEGAVRASQAEEVLAEAARAHIAVQTAAKRQAITKASASEDDALAARKQRRELLVAGAKRVALIVVPILTAGAGAIVALIAKGC